MSGVYDVCETHDCSCGFGQVVVLIDHLENPRSLSSATKVSQLHFIVVISKYLPVQVMGAGTRTGLENSFSIERVWPNGRYQQCSLLYKFREICFIELDNFNLLPNVSYARDDYGR